MTSRLHRISYLCCLILQFNIVAAQKEKTDSAAIPAVDFYKQHDLIDIAYLLLNKDPGKRITRLASGRQRKRFSAIPIAKYSNATGITLGFGGNIAFSTRESETNISNVKAEIKFTQKNQFLLPVQSSIWTPQNKFKLVGDWRYLDYPQDTYGLGGHTIQDDLYIVSFKHIRFYELVLRKISKDLYLGPGYQLDHHWAIDESSLQPGRITDFQRYGLSSSSTSSGISINLVYDSRKNAINPQAGEAYGGLYFLQNQKWLGSGSNWSSLTLDLRKYIPLPGKTILALWLYNVFTLAGSPPYLDLPGTASDTYNKTGRGYEQNRYSGKHMIDLEAELRFPISRNGLLGGVVFANAETLSELYTNRFEVISPAVGFGLRFKLNKFSATNICADYGFGTKGSRGFTGSLGEVF